MNIEDYLTEDLLTPEGRWKMLQEWLGKNPRNKRTLERWLKETPEEIWPQLKGIIAHHFKEQGDTLYAAGVRMIPLTPVARGWIEQLKQKYIERKAMDNDGQKPVKRKVKRVSR